MGLTRDLCQIVHSTRYESLGAECVDRVKQVIMDGIAVALAGCKAPQVAISVDHMRSLGGAPQAGVWGWATRVSMLQAAYINSAAMHLLDFEPMWKPSTHALSPTVPVAFALAETRPVTGKQIIATITKGLEIQGRLTYAANIHTSEKMRFHPPGVVGVLGAAVVAAELLELDVPAMQHALGVAASRTGSLVANIGSMTKCTHCAHAAASGFDAALLAKRGFTANPDVIEAPKGLAETFYPGTFEPEKLLGYGKPFRIVDPGFAIKLFPSQYGTHWVITAGLELHRQIGDPSRIARVRIVSPVSKYIDRPNPADGLEGKHSLQYTTAAALLDGKVTIDTFLDERRFRSDIVELLGKTEVVQDASIPSSLSEMRVAIAVELRDGRRLTAECLGPKGVWGIPLEAGDHRAKLEDCFGRVLPDQSVNEVLDLLEHLELQDVSGVRRIMSLIA